ncbi:MAG: tetraacyldisaccharide 4'-kinase, partial [Acidobacteria bacterium]|nr:tetraacyldisaccharide 4'-kinase [Acidobacteriota bacterium]
MRLLSTLYGAAARRRRRWYASRPAARRRLGRPVISVGALTVGGSGKTPVAAHVAALLARLGERPAVLSRGYRRAARPAGVVVVRDTDGIRAGVDEAGDEPLMLAERLPGACVLVCADRYRAGRLAEERFDVTVHVLDDGFQHLSLDRDVDLVVIGAADAGERRTLPGGRLREQPDTANLADALLVEAPSLARAASLAGPFGAGPVFR